MKRILSLVVAIALMVSTMLLSGCQLELNGSAKASAYYPKENNGDVYKSRRSQGRYTSDSAKIIASFGDDENKGRWQ